jgi:hypothetical protein
MESKIEKPLTAKPTMPPVRCTTPLPEKSITPTSVIVTSQPFGSQNCAQHASNYTGMTKYYNTPRTQCATIGYVNPEWNALSKTHAMNFERPAMLPPKIADEFAKNVKLKNHKIQSSSPAFINRNLEKPQKGLFRLPWPNDSAYPVSQYAMAHAPRSMEFFMSTFCAFVNRANPVSTMANPAKTAKSKQHCSQTVIGYRPRGPAELFGAADGHTTYQLA